MSRRTKLLITALFLVLLAIPTVYITFTWNPQEPWRARIVEVQDEQGGEKKKLVIEVENISSVPLCIYIAVVEGPSAPPDQSFPPSLEPLGPTAPSPPGWGVPHTLHVPSHQVRRFHITVSRADWEAMPESAWAVGLVWASGTKHRATTAFLWLQSHVPRSWEDHVPFPSLSDSNLPLGTWESAPQTTSHHQ
jgi:hypothetical protein